MSETPFFFPGEQGFILVDARQLPVVRFLVHRHLSHQDQDRLLVGHGTAHPQHTAKIPVEPLYPVGGVNHRLDGGMVLQIGEVVFVGNVTSHLFYTSVILSPCLANSRPPLPGFFPSVIPLPGAKDIA